MKRFVEAQDGIYEQVLAELRRGRKSSHWMWFIFPQLRGLGQSPTSRFFGLESIAEAKLYLGHELLGPRLRECTEALLEHDERSADSILGPVDAMKLKSSMTLFETAAAPAVPDRKLFCSALDLFFDGRRDEVTLRLLQSSA